MYGMKTFEFVQSNYNGGFPLTNEDGVGHGETVLVVRKRELFSLLYDYLHHMNTTTDMERRSEVLEILKDDAFVQRGPDLPEWSVVKELTKAVELGDEW
jgi:hypothetical protein